MNVILVLCDALRADHLGCYGYQRETSPFIDSLAEKSAVFENAFSVASNTKPSIASLFTSLYPSAHKIRHPVDVIKPEQHAQFKFNQELASLPSELKKAGFYTAAFSGNPHISQGFGFDFGFDEFHFLQDKDWNVKAENVNTAFFEKLDTLAGKQAFFTYLHYMDTHNPYKAPEGFYKKFEPVTGKDIYWPGVTKKVSEKDLQYTLARYDEEIAYFDACLRQLFEKLEKEGLLDDTLIIFTADHGEEFFEHENLGHWGSVYQPLLKIPLIMHAKNRIESQRVAEKVESIDIMPTILDFLGLDSSCNLQGESLKKMLEKKESKRRKQFCFSENQNNRKLSSFFFRQKAIQSSQFKLIENQEEFLPKANKRLFKDLAKWIISPVIDRERRPVFFRSKTWQELYDLENDPLEKSNVLREKPEKAEELKREMEKLENECRRFDLNIKSETKLDKGIEKQLKGLGYLT